MSRLSYGGDIFSPVRCDTSLNEDSFLEGRNSDVFFGTWDDLSLKNNSYQGKKGAEKICKLATDTEQDKLTKGKETAISKQNRSSKSKLHENPIDINSSNGSSKEINSSVNKISYITTRKSSRSLKKTNKLNESEGTEKSSNRKHKVSKHVTMRSSTQKSNIQLVEDFKENESFPNSAFPTLKEEYTDVSIDSYGSNKDNSIQHLTVMSNKQAYLQPQDIQSEKSCAHTLAEPAVKQKQIAPQSEVMSFNNNHKSGVTPSKVNCESQTDLLMSELSLANYDLATGKHGLNAHENQGSNLFALQNSSQSQQIQAGIIEKLVKDTVSFEFDSIRQMLYMQQLSLFRHLDRNAEAMKQNSYDCDILCKILNELMEENKHLRRIISNQNC